MIDDDEDPYEVFTLGYPKGEVRTSLSKTLFAEYYKAVDNITLRVAFTEFYDQSVQSALDQIDDRDYKAAFLEDDKPVIKLAIKFSSNTRNIESYEAVEEKI